MRMHCVQKHGCKYVDGLVTQQFVQREEDAVALVDGCGEHAAKRLLLYIAQISQNGSSVSSRDWQVRYFRGS